MQHVRLVVAASDEMNQRNRAQGAAHVPLGVHFHNTRNTAYANAYAALQLGVTIFDASVGGFGGCPFAPRPFGNIATEDLVHLFNGMGVGSGVALAPLIATGAWLGEQHGMAYRLRIDVGERSPT